MYLNDNSYLVKLCIYTGVHLSLTVKQAVNYLHKHITGYQLTSIWTGSKHINTFVNRLFIFDISNPYDFYTSPLKVDRLTKVRRR